MFNIAQLTWASVKQKLRSGEISVSGDQWPIFLYANYKFDPEEPWKGLLKSSILVSVSVVWYHINLWLTLLFLTILRLISTFLHLLALSIKLWRPQDLVMQEFTEWLRSLHRPLRTLLLRYGSRPKLAYGVKYLIISSGTVRSLFLICILQDRYCHGFGMFLREYIDSPWRYRWTEKRFKSFLSGGICESFRGGLHYFLSSRPVQPDFSEPLLWPACIDKEQRAVKNQGKASCFKSSSSSRRIEHGR